MLKYKSYEQNQPLLLPPSLEDLIGEKDLVRVVNHVIDHINPEIIDKAFKGGGCPSYNPVMMLKVIIYAYSCKVYSCRKIALSLKRDIAFMWLSAMQTPDFNTINRFRSNYFNEILEKVFSEVVIFLLKNSYVSTEDYFVDGTKIEANAGKNTYVWKRNTERFSKKVKQRAAEIIKEADQINEFEENEYKGKDLPETGSGNNFTSKSLKKAAEVLAEKVNDKMPEKMKKKVLSKSKKLLKESDNLEKYEKQKETLGHRNSYSKTDPDATFMRLKNELLRPAYNIQAGTQNSYITGYSVSQNANDSVTFIEHVEKRKNLNLPKVATITADAAYGTEENYEYMKNILSDTECYLKYPTFYREQKNKMSKFSKEKFEYDSQKDQFICPAKRILTFKKIKTKETSTGFKQSLRVYQCDSCKKCIYSEKCKKTCGNRKIEINKNLDNYKNEAKKKLLSQKGISLRRRRAPEVETVFGDMKQNMGIKKLILRGKEKVNSEIALIFSAYNLRKMALAL